jgi:hypothetical protein
LGKPFRVISPESVETDNQGKTENEELGIEGAAVQEKESSQKTQGPEKEKFKRKNSKDKRFQSRVCAAHEPSNRFLWGLSSPKSANREFE